MKRLVLVLVALLVMPAIASATPPSDCFGAPTNDARATDDADFLTGSEGDDVIALGTGADQYFAFTGDDVLCGNDGDDLLVGEGGADQLAGGDGDDHLVGFGSADVLSGGFGADVLEGDGGADVLKAAATDGVEDQIYDGVGTDVIVGNAEDTWFRCDDDAMDDHDGFAGQIAPDPNC